MKLISCGGVPPRVLRRVFGFVFGVWALWIGVHSGCLERINVRRWFDANGARDVLEQIINRMLLQTS